MNASNDHAHRRADLVVIGGGLAGLTAAALVAKAGRSVILLERAKDLGGRAATHVRQGAHFNLGPHALYCAGRAFRTFRDLGIPFSGAFPNTAQGFLATGDRLDPIPRTFRGLLRSRFLSLREKWQFLGYPKILRTADTRTLDGIAFREWAERTWGVGALTDAIRTLARVSTFAADHDRLSAGATIDQLRVGLEGNVWYLDGGWQTLVDGLRDLALAEGAEIRTGARAESITADAAEGVAVRLAGCEVIRGRAAIVASAPKVASDLLGLPADHSLARHVEGCVPIRAACLDLALDGLPRPDRSVVFRVDRPLYYSVHSDSARLGPEGLAVLHLMKYLGEGPEESPAAIEAELEGELDQLQPGWRARVVERRYLPGMIVAYNLPRAEQGGLAGRPDVAVAGQPNVFLAGDWVGPEGMLSDASVASASEAARRVLQGLDRTTHRSLAHAGV